MNRRDLLRLLGSALAPAAAAASRVGAAGAIADQSTGNGFVPDVELRLTAAPNEVSILPRATTRVWRFSGEILKGPAGILEPVAGSYLGPTIRLRRGQRVRIRFRNQLPEPSIVHWHGLDVPEAADGHPRRVVPRGAEYVSDFEVTNRAGTYWYHPHPDMRTGAQAYSGLAGLIVVDDPEEQQLRLPSGNAEHFCVLQDRRFDAGNQLVFHDGTPMSMMDGFLGDRILVNGQLPPTIDVDAGWQRLRLLNGSNARIYKLAWNPSRPLTVIGGDGGLLERPVVQSTLTLAPGQRADVLVDLSDLSAGSELRLESRPFAESDAATTMGRGMRGMSGMRGRAAGTTSTLPNGGAFRVLTLRTRAQKGASFALPSRLSAPDTAIVSDAPVRRVTLSFERMNWLIGGRTFEMNGVAREETVAAGSTHIWELANLTNPMGMQAAHPIHLHGRHFRVLSRSGGSSNALREGLVDAGWKDTVLVLPGETVRVQVTFSRHPGTFLYHCHILEHEDMGMMRNFKVV